jgi:LPXTG-motif cell wall-anchored protein
MMNSMRFAALTSLAALVSLAPLAKADQWDKKTILTVKESIQLPNTVLQPGTYTFKLLDSASDRHVVQVFDKDGMHLITTLLAIPNYRLQPTGHSAFAFWEVPAGQPPAMRAWFYPGDNFGQEFAYPKNMSTQIASSAKMVVPTTAAVSNEEYKTAKIDTTDETGKSADLDAKTYTRTEVAEAAPVPAPAPEPAPAPPVEVAAPVPQPSEMPAELPQTGSSAPLIGLIGLFSMLAFFGVRSLRVR